MEEPRDDGDNNIDIGLGKQTTIRQIGVVLDVLLEFLNLSWLLLHQVHNLFHASWVV